MAQLTLMAKCLEQGISYTNVEVTCDQKIFEKTIEHVPKRKKHLPSSL